MAPAHVTLALWPSRQRLDSLAADERALARAVKALVALGLLYTLTVLVGALRGYGAAVPSLLPIPAEHYYWYELFFALPVWLGATALFAAVTAQVSRALGGRGSFTAVLAVDAFAQLVPVLVTMWLPETLLFLLVPAGPERGGFPGVPPVVDAIRQLGGILWWLAVTVIGVARVERLSGPRATLAVLVGKLPALGLIAATIR